MTDLLEVLGIDVDPEVLRSDLFSVFRGGSTDSILRERKQAGLSPFSTLTQRVSLHSTLQSTPETCSRLDMSDLASQQSTCIESYSLLLKQADSVLRNLHDLSLQTKIVKPQSRPRLERLLELLSNAFTRSPNVFLRLLFGVSSKRAITNSFLLKARYMTRRAFLSALRRVSDSSCSEEDFDACFSLVCEWQSFEGSEILVADMARLLVVLDRSSIQKRRTFELPGVTRERLEAEFWSGDKREGKTSIFSRVTSVSASPAQPANRKHCSLEHKSMADALGSPRLPTHITSSFVRVNTLLREFKANQVKN
jgi:hypothetical protein